MWLTILINVYLKKTDKQYVGFVLLLCVTDFFASFDFVDHLNYAEMKMTINEVM